MTKVRRNPISLIIRIILSVFFSLMLVAILISLYVLFHLGFYDISHELLCDVNDVNDRKEVTRQMQAKQRDIHVDIVVEAADNQVSKKGQSADGLFPPIWASYRDSIGFRQYYNEMTDRGAVFFLYSTRQKSWMQIDFTENTLKSFDISRLGKDLTDAPNIINNEPSLSQFIEMAQTRNAEVYVAKPVPLISRIQDQIGRQISTCGAEITSVTGIKGKYVKKRGQLVLQLETISTKEGKQIHLNTQILL